MTIKERFVNKIKPQPGEPEMSGVVGDCAQPLAETTAQRPKERIFQYTGEGSMDKAAPLKKGPSQ